MNASATQSATQTIPEESRTHAAFLALLNAAFHDPAVKLVPIRQRANDLATALDRGDYDLLLPSRSHPDFLRLLVEVMRPAEVSFTIDSIKPGKRRIMLHAPEAERNITIELWSHLDVRDPAHCCARIIPWSAIEPVLLQTRAGWRLPPAIEAFYYLSHLATRRKKLDHPEVQRRLAGYHEHSGDPRVAMLIDRLRSQRAISIIAAEANRLLVDAGLLKPLHGPVDRVKSFFEAIPKHWLRRRRRAITRRQIFAVTGPDGVGKTTVIKTLCDDLASKAIRYRFKNLFRQNPLYQILSALRFKSAAKAHGGKLATNLFDEMQAPALFRIARLGFPWLRLRARLGPYHFCDRYFHELLFDDLRRSGATPRLREGWEHLVPTMPLPAWHLHLDAADAVILARKRELSPASLDCYRKGVFAIHLAADTPYFTYLNTGRPLDEVRTVLRLAGAPLGLRFRP